MSVSAAEPRDFAAKVARATGVPGEEADVTADGMVWAELRGVDLGIKRLTTLVRRIQAGGTRADSRPAVVKDLPSFAVLDGHDGWGQVRPCAPSVSPSRRRGPAVSPRA